MTTTEFRETLQGARRVATPIIAIRTADPASAVAHIEGMLNGKLEATPMISYDMVTGLRGRNKLGLAAVKAILDEADPRVAPSEALASIQTLPQRSIVLFFNPQRLWEQPDVSQAIWLLRDIFKGGGQMLVLITTPGVTLPAEIRNDVMIFDEPLPSTDDLKILVADVFEEAKQGQPEIKTPTPEVVEKAVDALIGLASYPAEAVLALSLSKTGLNHDQLWDRKRQAIEQTRGLSVWRGGQTFADIGGCGNAKKFITGVMKGKEAPRVIICMEEIEKAFAGAGTDTSGVKADLSATMLTHMQDTEADGILAIGPPGCAKSLLSRAIGATFDRVTLGFDFAGMQSGIVGSSGENIRAALQVVTAISQGRALWIGTCNSVTNLSPELQRRFSLAKFFFDLPDAQEREAIWKLYEKKYGVSGPRPNDEGFSGADIKECARKAYRLNLTLVEAARYIIPGSRTSADQILTLRRQSSGRFLNAAQPGEYVYEEKLAPVAVTPKRKFSAQ